MKLSHQWLLELTDAGLSPQETADRLTAAGLVVEAMTPAAGGDTCLDAEVTTNRPDWLGHIGVARELAAITGCAFQPPAAPLAETGPPAASLTSVIIEDDAREWCPRYTARVIRDVRVGPSPAWLQNRLLAIGQRPINNVVDITNYVQFEWNQPLHAFDMDWLAEQRIVVRRSRPGEAFAAITGETGALDGRQLVIADARRVVALAGVKGGQNSEVTPRTRHVLLEAAYFQPAQVRRSGRDLKMASEAQYRFERGIDPGGVAAASARAASLLAQLAGGVLCEGVIDTAPDLGRPIEVTLRWARVERLLGARFDEKAMLQTLESLGLACRSNAGGAAVFAVPSFRGDLAREVDLIEEIARVMGYHRIPEALRLPVASHAAPPRLEAAAKARDTLAALGYNECFCDAFVPAAWLGHFPDPAAPAGTPSPPGQAYEARNPVNSQRAFLRDSLLPSLLEVRAVNRSMPDAKLFEINRVYARGPDGRPRETERVAILDDGGVAAARGALEAVAAALHAAHAPRLAPWPGGIPAPSGAEPGWTATMGLDGQDAGWGVLGQISRAEAERHSLRSRPGFAECCLEALAAAGRRVRMYTPLPRFPGIRRDIALVVLESVLWGEIEAVILRFAGSRAAPGAAGGAADDLRLEPPAFESVYRGEGLEEGVKSMAFSFVCRAESRSLTDEEANHVRDLLARELMTAFPGARLR